MTIAVAGGGFAASAAPGQGAARHQQAVRHTVSDRLPAPPAPSSAKPHSHSHGAHALLSRHASRLTPALVKNYAVAAPASATTWGVSGPATTLVVYDSTNTYGWLGELYGLAAGNLASHFGRVTAEPVVDYQPGQVGDYTATIYLGSTYNEPLPASFRNDVATTTRPVIWAGDNIWELSGAAGSATATAFADRYGWDASTSYFDLTDTVSTVSYNGQTLTRSTLNAGGILSPHIVDPTKVDVIATGQCTDTTGAVVNCAPLAQTTGSTLPWAVRSGNLTYVGEIPFSYISERDRYLAFSDLLFNALAPAAAPEHHALVRLEDVNPTSNPTVLRRFADALSAAHVPFSVGVIPEYTDPNGYYNGGVPETITLAQRPAVVSALKYMQSKGGTIVQHGFTHQYSATANPYDGVSADDFEFYRAECSATQYAPYQFDSSCPNTDWVINEGPLPGDSTSWAASRVTAGRRLFAAAGLSAPTIWETPHYAASAADYAGIGQTYGTRYEREIFPAGLLSGHALDYSRAFGQFFPYVVHDVYGTKIIPEDLGNEEPVESNHNPPRLPADIIGNARANLVVTQGVASFFFHPDYPLRDLQQIVSGIKSLGYTFVSPTAVS